MQTSNPIIPNIVYDSSGQISDSVYQKLLASMEKQYTVSDATRWKLYMREQRGRWTIDPIHNGRNGQDLLCFVVDQHDPTSGVYIRVYPVNEAEVISVDDDGEPIIGKIHARGCVEAGTFTGAYPHIGEACFKSQWIHAFQSMERALGFVAIRAELVSQFVEQWIANSSKGT